jgi:hypothetical protein
MGVEGCDLIDLGQSEPHFLRQSGEMRGRKMTVAILNQVQMLDQQIAPPLALAKERTYFLKRARLDLAALWRARTPASPAAAALFGR